MKTAVRRNIFPVLLFAILFVGSLLCFLAAGPKNDDICYMHEFIGREPMNSTFDYCRGELITTPRQVISSIGFHYLYWTNGRLGSAIIFAANLWPFRLTATISALSLAAMFLLVMRLALGREWKSRPLACVLIAIGLWWLLPWHEYMLAQAYAINYMWASALCLWFLLLLAQRRGRMGWMCLLALVASLMHEGLSLTMDVLLLCVCIRHLVKRGWQSRLMVPSLVFGLGSLAVLLSPSVFLRSEGVTEYVPHTLRLLVQLLVMKDWIFTLTLLFIPIARFMLGRRRFRRWWGGSWPVLVAGSVTLLGRFIVGGEALRQLWLSDILLYIVCLRALRPLRLSLSRGVRTSVAVVLSVVMGCWLCAVAGVQYKLSRQIERVSRKYIATGSPIIFEHTDSPRDLPWWTLGIPITFRDDVFPLSFHLFQTGMRSRFPDADPRYMQLVVLEPADSLRPFDRWTLIPGTARLRRSGSEVMLADRFLGYSADYTYGDPDIDSGVRSRSIPWYTLRHQFLPRPIRAKRFTVLYCKHIPLTAIPHLRHLLPASAPDTLHFYEPWQPQIPRVTRGLPIISIDTIPKTNK